MKSDKKIHEWNLLGIVLQGIVTILVGIGAVLAFLIDSKYFVLFEILMAIDLLIMAWNNHRVYQTPKVTILYIIVSICLWIHIVLSLLGVV